MSFTEAGKNEALDGMTLDLMSLHTGAPGATGANNEYSGGGYARKACAFDAAAGGARALSSNVVFDGVPAENVSHFAIWEDGAPDVCKSTGVLVGDTAFDTEGEYTVLAGLTVEINDP